MESAFFSSSYTYFFEVCVYAALIVAAASCGVCVTRLSLQSLSVSTVFQPMRASLATARVELLELLSSVLLGDRVAAEYLLLHLLSRV